MKKMDLSKILSFIPAVLLGLAHIVVIIAVILSYKYYAIYPSIFISIVAIIILFLLIIDIILLVGTRHKDKVLKVIAGVLATLVIIGGSVGIYYIHQVNKAVSGVVDGNSGGSETISGMFVSYKKEYPTLKDMNGKSIGFLNESTEGITSIASELLDKNKIDYGSVPYNSYIEMYQALIDGKVDLAVMQSGYRGMFEKDENLDFEKYFDDTYDNYTFEGKITTEGRKNNKKIDTEPFNVLLIGWSRTEWGSTIGLADAIILATINPQTYTVSMTSIARDSFVPISCYDNAPDKINSGRSTSRACFIETVENFIGKEVDFYMEADYDAIVNIVETIDGIWIYNPTAFELDGIEVPEGYFQADGWQALEFCRERHHMAGGDFDRQQHQKEVILAIARKLVEEADVSLALRALQSASEDLSTDLSVNQLTSIFNMILNTKNYTGLDTFDLLDFHTLRITGSGGIMYYSYSMRLPLWVYLIYQGSYDDCMNHVEEVMGNYKTKKQDNSFVFASNDPYEREPFTSEDYPSNFMYKPDPMPPYWANLTEMTMSDALAWASEKGVTLSVKHIEVGDAKYDASLEGMVVDQSVRYGALISEYKSGTITVMGTGEIDESKQVPNFVGKNYTEAVNWANKYDVHKQINYAATNESDKIGKVISQTPTPGTMIETARESGGLTIAVGAKELSTGDLVGKSLADAKTWAANNLAYEASFVVNESETPGTDKVVSVTFNTDEHSTFFTYSKNVVITVERYKPRYTVTYDANGGTFSDGTSTKEVTYKEGDSPSCESPTRNNYNFEGWSQSGSTYTATWSEKTARVDVDASQGGSNYSAEYVETSDSSLDGTVFGCTMVYNYATGLYVDGTKACKVYTYVAPQEPQSEDNTNP